MPVYKDENPVDFELPEQIWKPRAWTAMKSSASLGDDIADYIDMFVTPPRISADAPPFRVLPWQRWLLRHMFELNAFGLLRYREIYLQIPRKNGKSFLCSGIIQYFLTKASDGEQIYCAAHDTKQARIIFDEVVENVKSRPVLRKLLQPMAEEVKHNIARRSFFRPLGADGYSAQGFAPYISVIDELHTLDSLTGKSTKGQRLLDAIKEGSGDRKEYMTIMISTAGDRENGLAHKEFQYGLQVAEGNIENDSYGFFCWAAEDDDDIGSEETWAKANPMFAVGVVDKQGFRDTWRKAAETNTSSFEIYRLNKWLRNRNQADFISAFAWEKCRRPQLGKIPKGAEITVGFDGAKTEDSTGLVAFWPEGNKLEILYGWDKNPKIQDWHLSDDDVEAAYEQIQKDYVVLKTYADPSRHGPMVDRWKKTYGRGVIRDMPPTSKRMGTISQEFKGAIMDEKIFYNDDDVSQKRLTAHALNAIETIRGVPNKEHSDSPNKIDYLACSVLAYAAWIEVESRTSNGSGIIAFKS